MTTRQIRAGIVEDEYHSRETLRKLVERHCPEVEVVFLAADVEEAQKSLLAHTIDLLFLDIQLPGKSGFDLLESLGEVHFELVFTTSYADYAIHAIKFYALDYLLKPIGIVELEEAVARVRKKMGVNPNRQALGQLQQALQVQGMQDNKMAFPIRDGYLFLRVGDIVRCESDGRYTWIYMLGGKRHLLSRHLKEFENLLTPFGFFRVHHLHIINLQHLKHYQKGEGGRVTLVDGHEIEVSRRRKKQFLEQLTRL